MKIRIIKGMENKMAEQIFKNSFQIMGLEYISVGIRTFLDKQITKTVYIFERHELFFSNSRLSFF